MIYDIFLGISITGGMWVRVWVVHFIVGWTNKQQTDLVFFYVSLYSRAALIRCSKGK